MLFCHTGFGCRLQNQISSPLVFILFIHDFIILLSSLILFSASLCRITSKALLVFNFYLCASSFQSATPLNCYLYSITFRIKHYAFRNYLPVVLGSAFNNKSHRLQLSKASFLLFPTDIAKCVNPLNELLSPLTFSISGRRISSILAPPLLNGKM